MQLLPFALSVLVALGAVHSAAAQHVFSGPSLAAQDMQKVQAHCDGLFADGAARATAATLAALRTCHNGGVLSVLAPAADPVLAGAPATGPGLPIARPTNPQR